MSSTKRYVELDLLRTLAIVLMVLYHLVFDLANVYHWNINVWSGPWKAEGRIAAILFLLLVGISFAISWQRTKETNESKEAKESKEEFSLWFPRFLWIPSDVYRKYAIRGCIILGWGMVITIATRMTNPTDYIRFGILHLIGTAAFLLPLITHLRLWNVLLAILVIAIGHFLNVLALPTGLLLPLGIPPQHFQTLDYYPLFPWFGVILLGYVMGNELYVTMNLAPQRTSSRIIASLSWPGRHSLAIYLIHQPIILGILYMILG